MFENRPYVARYAKNNLNAKQPGVSINLAESGRRLRKCLLQPIKSRWHDEKPEGTKNNRRPGGFDS